MSTSLLRTIGFPIASVFFIGLLTFHILTLLDVALPWNFSMFSGFLVLFPTWLLTIIYLNKSAVDNKITQADFEGISLIEKIKLIMGNPPKWLLMIAGIFYIYGSVCSVWWFYQMLTAEGGHGHPMPNYTNAELMEIYRKNTVSVTGFLMAFAAFSFAVFFPKIARNG